MDPITATALALFVVRKGKEAYDEMMKDHSDLTPEQFLDKWTASAAASAEAHDRWDAAAGSAVSE